MASFAVLRPMAVPQVVVRPMVVQPAVVRSEVLHAQALYAEALHAEGLHPEAGRSAVVRWAVGLSAGALLLPVLCFLVTLLMGQWLAEALLRASSTRSTSPPGD